MEIPDTDFGFANSIVPILQSFPTKATFKIRNTAGLNEIQIWWLGKKTHFLKNTSKRVDLSVKLQIKRRYLYLKFRDRYFKKHLSGRFYLW